VTHTPLHEGRLRIDPRGHSVHYRVYGDGPETLLSVHGGPGAGSDLDVPFAELTSAGKIRVVIYDQLGCGRSDRPDDPSLWTIRRFVDEIDAVRTGLGLGRVHLIGRSWGGILALQYALDYQANLQSLIVTNSGADGTAISRAVQKRYMELPVDVYRQVLRYNHGEAMPPSEVYEFLAEFEGRFLRRPTPFDLEEAKRYWLALPPWYDELTQLQSFQTLWGTKITQCTGPIRDWSALARLREIRVPTLIMCGWYDETPMELHREMADLIPDNEFIVFGHSSHLITHEKEAPAYLGVIENFVTRHAAASVPA
jgi:proline-specific peptidase